MNPEFERNLWLEMTPRRALMMPIVLGLIFLAAAAAPGGEEATAKVAQAARWLYFLIVIFWGTRAAAAAVASEIRERTWDGQRLSALTPFQMLTGKLFGATSYQWFGGLICLAGVAVHGLVSAGVRPMLAELLYLVSIGLFAQSISLLASLVAVHRRAGHTRFDIFVYQIAGLAAAFVAARFWDVTYVAELIALRAQAQGLEMLTWWGANISLQGFYLVSLLVFLGWSYIGNLTLLRSELQVRTSPLPWAAFLLFAVAYGAGFANNEAELGAQLITVRLTIAMLVCAMLTYSAIVLEPKDPVLYRWLIGEFGRGRLDRVAGGLQSWMCGLILLTLLVLQFQLTYEPPFKEIFGFTQKLAPAVLAAYIFVLRDIGIFLYFGMRATAGRGDFGAIVTLGVLYLVLPVTVGGFGPARALGLFYPNPDASTLMMIAAPLAEAALIWGLALKRLRSLMAPRVA